MDTRRFCCNFTNKGLKDEKKKNSSRSGENTDRIAVRQDGIHNIQRRKN